MKKDKIRIAILILVLLIASIIIAFKLSLKDVNIPQEKHILIEKSYSNYAWGHVYEGTFICTDGTIYKFDYSNSKSMDKINEEYMLKHSKKTHKKISKNDMKILYENAVNLKDKIKRKNVAMDAGSHSISVWVPNKNKKIYIKESGDFKGTNNTKESKVIRFILKKYLIS